MIKQLVGQMREYHGARAFDQTQGSQWREEAHADAPITMMTIDITIHDKMSATWQNGAGDGTLRDIV